MFNLLFESSSSESEDELDILLMTNDINLETDINLAIISHARDNLTKISEFLSVIDDYTEVQFKGHFRFCRSTVKFITGLR